MIDHNKNRRIDKRLQLPDLQIKVKKHGLGESGQYIDCKPVDISMSGLAFTSDELDLDMLQKIDICLSVGSREINGRAVICHIEQQFSGIRFGVLYIDIQSSLEEALSLDSLTTDQVKELAASMADNAVLKNARNDQRIRLTKAKILLFESVQSFMQRICELTDDVLDEHGNAYNLKHLFEFNDVNQSVTVPLLSDDEQSIVRHTISPVLTDSGRQVVFQIEGGGSFNSLLDFLQDLTDTFQQLLSDSHS